MGLIYRYFGNKLDLVQAVIVDVLDDVASRLGRRLRGLLPDHRRAQGCHRALRNHRPGASCQIRRPAGWARLSGRQP
ncbi:hypothetical protein ACR80S_03880 [Halomonas sp. MA07-2]|uniref:hypothetical protein n=1 Tax=Halomonas sp. RA08-2 TaxID=3440842 RepID=UPI003EE86A84